TRDVDDGLSERLVERDERVAVTRDPRLVTESLADRLAEDDRGVLNRVMDIDVRITRGYDREIGQRVLGERRKHVVEERDGGRDRALPRAVEVQRQLDRRLARRAGAGRGARGGHSRILFVADARQRVQEGCCLFFRAGGDAEVTGDADVTNENTLVAQ